MITARIFAKLDYVAGDGSVPLYLRLTIHRKVHPIKLGKRVDPIHWDAERGRVKHSHPNHDKLNKLLELLQRKADDVILDHELRERPLTMESFSREFSGLSPYDFYYVADKYVASIRETLSQSYVDKVQYVVGKLKNYAPHVNLNQVDFAFIDSYMTYLRSKLSNTQNTVNSNVKILRRIFRYAVKLKLVRENPFEEVRLPHVRTERGSLSKDEFLGYENLLKEELPYYLRKTLIWFLLACCTGRRYQDLQNFYSWEFDEHTVRITQRKKISTREEHKVVTLYLNERIRKLAALVRAEKLEVIGPASDKFLKTINGMVGISRDRKITWHSARHTFANINKSLTSDLTIRRDLLGHDSVKSTLIYDHVNPQQLQQVMSQWDNL